MKNSGQTLLEVMIALFVLTVGILGILSLLSQSIFLSKTVSNQTTATFLASEGIELAKNLIDHNVYQGIAFTTNEWNTGIGGGGNFELDYTTCNNLPNPATLCPTPPNYSGTFLSFDPAANVYVYAYDDLSGGLVATPFQRLIRVTPNGGNEITVQSIVTWNVGQPSQTSLDVEDHFYNWLP